MTYYMLVGFNPQTGNQIDQDFTSKEAAELAMNTHPIWKQMVDVTILELEETV